jgi:hypothetical protein
MKYNFTRLIPALAVVVLLYASCKKTEVKTTPVTPAVDYKALSAKIAINLYQAITSQNGVNINSGISMPSKVTGNVKSLVLNSSVGQCGFTTSPYSKFHTTPGDSVVNESIQFTFVTTCTVPGPQAIADGYTVLALDTLAITTPNTFYHRTMDQYYTVHALDKTYKKFSMDGTLNALTSSGRTDGPTYSAFGYPTNADGITALQKYTLKGLVVNILPVANPDVASGTAEFQDLYNTTNINNPYGKFSGDGGVIEFLGNHTVKVTFSNGQGTFIIHLLDYTGVPG